jgi:hypothetical protein
MTRTIRTVRWRGFEEECAGRQDAIDRWVQLDARGIEAEVLMVAGEGRERPASLADSARFGATPHCSKDAPQPEPHGATKAAFRTSAGQRRL